MAECRPAASATALPIPESGISLSQSLESQSPSPHIVSWLLEGASSRSEESESKRVHFYVMVCRQTVCSGGTHRAVITGEFFFPLLLSVFFIVTQRSHQPPSAVIAVDGPGQGALTYCQNGQGIARSSSPLACCTVIINSEYALVVVRVRVICIHVRTQSSPKPAAVEEVGNKNKYQNF